MTPEEFGAVADRWGEHQMSVYRSGWEQARFIAMQISAPYSRKPLKATDIIRFPWDNQPAQPSAASREYFEDLKKRYGNE